MLESDLVACLAAAIEFVISEDGRGRVAASILTAIVINENYVDILMKLAITDRRH